jgi:hypothetical protein
MTDRNRTRLGAGDLSPAQPARRGLRTRLAEHPLLERTANLFLFSLAVISGLLGLWLVWIHLMSDPIADARAYYDAASRLNHGLPLYPPDIDPSTNLVYLYPPLLAVALRPLAVLPFNVFALVWEAIVLGSFALLVRQLGGGKRVWTAIGILGIPIGWALSVGQAHVPLTLLLAIGQPWSIALAANIKVFPALIALWWLGRRDYESFSAFLVWLVIIGIVEFVLEPAGTLAFLHGGVGLAQLGDVRNISPYAWASPLAWSVIVLAGALVTVALARTRWGWAVAVTFATLASPRLLVYMLTGLLAAIRQPHIAGEPDPEAPLDTVTAFAKAVR